MKVHFSGVAGVGMSNLARLALGAGHRVTGSDRRLAGAMNQLLAEGAECMLHPQSGDGVADADLLVRSTAVPDENPDVVVAREHGLPVWTRMQFLSRLVQHRETIAVAGSFGKSSMAALIADVLLASGMDPTVYVGASMPSLGSGARWGAGRLAVVEACEYRREILHLTPRHLLIANLAVNHEDEFGFDLTRVTRLFDSYLQINADRLETVWIGEHDAGVRRLRLDGLKSVQTWGTPASEWHTRSLGVQADLQRLQLLHRGRDAGVFRTRWCGLHIVRSLAPVLGMAKMLGLPDEVLAQALTASHPLPRRYDIVHADTDLEVVDDNARLPDQVATTVASARARAGVDGRVVAVLGVWGMLNRRDLTAYAAAVAGCDQVRVLPSAAFEHAQGGPEPEGADAALIALMRGKGVDAHRLGASADVAASLPRGNGRTVVVTMGYESFAPVFSEIHGLFRLPAGADATLATA